MPTAFAKLRMPSLAPFDIKYIERVVDRLGGSVLYRRKVMVALHAHIVCRD